MDDQPAFAFKGAVVSIGEVLRAAHFRGDLGACAARLAWEGACAAEADRLNVAPDEAAVDELANAFRYEKDLVSAEEIEAWLEPRGLTPENFQDYFVRRIWWKMLRERIAPPGEPEAYDHAALAVQALISGDFGPFARDLSRRLVALDAVGVPEDPRAVAQERRRFHDRTGLAPAALPGWLATLGRDPAWFEGMLEREAAYRQVRENVLTPARLAQALASARQALTRLDVESAEFDTIDAAREAHLCVREDGLTLQEVASESRYPFQRQSVLAEDLPEEERQSFLWVPLGDVNGPSFSGGLYRLSRVLARTDPSLEDGSIRERIERRVLDAHFAEAGADAIRWLVQ